MLSTPSGATLTVWEPLEGCHREQAVPLLIPQVAGEQPSEHRSVCRAEVEGCQQLGNPPWTAITREERKAGKEQSSLPSTRPGDRERGLTARLEIHREALCARIDGEQDRLQRLVAFRGGHAVLQVSIIVDKQRRRGAVANAVPAHAAGVWVEAKHGKCGQELAPPQPMEARIDGR